MASLWPGTFVEEANLSFQVSMLRKALGNGALQWIETVPKHGYRFTATWCAWSNRMARWRRRPQCQVPLNRRQPPGGPESGLQCSLDPPFSYLPCPLCSLQHRRGNGKEART